MLFQNLRHICTSVCFILTIFSASLAQAAGITNFPALVKPDYWIKNNPRGEQVLLDAKGVQSFNATVRELTPTVVDLASFPVTISGDALKSKILNYESLEDELYLNGKRVSDNYKNILRTQTNVQAIPETVTARHAIVVRRTNVRQLPTGQSLFYYPEDTEFDMLQQTIMDPGEPVLVQHVSTNGFFYFVQCYNYYGWISKYDLAFTDRNTWLSYLQPKNFLVVKGSDYRVKLEKEELYYEQGAKLVYREETPTGYVLDIPERQTQTNVLQHTYVTVPKNGQLLHKGYLPYTANNIIRAAFAYYGKPYSWGGLKKSVDCSSLVLNAYRTTGIFLPRNADEQVQTAGTKYIFDGVSSGMRDTYITRLLPGAVLYMDGHIVMYLGTSNKIPFVIQSLASYIKDNGERQREMKVVVSNLSLKRADGKTQKDSILCAAEYK